MSGLFLFQYYSKSWFWNCELYYCIFFSSQLRVHNIQNYHHQPVLNNQTAMLPLILLSLTLWPLGQGQSKVGQRSMTLTFHRWLVSTLVGQPVWILHQVTCQPHRNYQRYLTWHSNLLKVTFETLSSSQENKMIFRSF